MGNRTPGKKWRDTYLWHPLQGAALIASYRLWSLLPVSAASACGSLAGRLLGRFLTTHNRRAAANLAAAFPEKSPAEHRRIIRGMWENLGRMLAEMPHLEAIWRSAARSSGRLDIIGSEHIIALRDDNAPGIFVSGHIGNWEVVSLAATKLGVPLTNVYRPPNNPIADRLLRRARRAVSGEVIPKGRTSARLLIEKLKSGGHIGMMVDQKLNAGMAIPFFGRLAMTSTAPADLALRFGCPLVLARCERIRATHFRVTVLPPLPMPHTTNRGEAIQAVLTAINIQLESWIRERPEQWLWMHRRWPAAGETWVGLALGSEQEINMNKTKT